MKKFFSVILLIIFSFNIFAFCAYAQEEILIDDAADLFDEMQEEGLNASLLSFTLETSYSSAVITTDNSEGKTSQAYADDYYDNLVVSEGWSQNGILFLIDMDNREVCISTMGDCITLYSDYIDYIIDNGYDELVGGNYYECIVLMIDAAYECFENSVDNNYYGDYYDDNYYGDYPVYDDGYYENAIDYPDASKHSSGISIGNVVTCVVIALVIAAISVFAVRSRYKNTGKGDEFDSDDVILNLTGSNDTVISRNVITTRIPKNNNNHHRPGGGVGGGGVSHRSSGGFSHGGGSRKF